MLGELARRSQGRKRGDELRCQIICPHESFLAEVRLAIVQEIVNIQLEAGAVQEDLVFICVHS